MSNVDGEHYRGTSPRRKRLLLGPYSSATPRALQGYLAHKNPT
eukprot:CAMPEP_0180208910 /NCGR_PEP_ID=MMETSP0987-20121128/11088_1 /TAXON_ID=697907 /ORGANISM="non described non described, Strain CCMP2293" /LENGTH=42 /DNA_ID= /DNA_START= /DNA_END= /DNA_ORIENTATION=